MSSLPQTFVPGFHDEKEVLQMEYRPLGSTGLEVSKLSLGAGGFSDAYGYYNIEECKKIVKEALKRGINYIDTAPYYGCGVSETILGECLKDIPRNSYYLATKVGRYDKDPKKMFDFSAEKTKESINTSLKRMGVEYIDLIQVHDVEFASDLNVIIEETLPVLIEAVKSGKAKYIGITGYPVSTLKELLIMCQKRNIRIDTVLSYSRLTLTDTSLLEYIPFFKDLKLGIINAAVNGMGLFSKYGPPEWHPAHEHIKEICTEARNYCEKNNVELGKLAVYYSNSFKGPDTMLAGMNRFEILENNLNVLRNGLSDKELEVFNYLQENVFSKLQQHHWENVELIRYRECIAKN